MTSHIFYDIEVILSWINLLFTCTSFCWHHLETKFRYRLHFWGEAKVNRGTGILYTIYSCRGDEFVWLSMSTYPS